jgi:hypothetical protein
MLRTAHIWYQTSWIGQSGRGLRGGWSASCGGSRRREPACERQRARTGAFWRWLKRSRQPASIWRTLPAWYGPSDITSTGTGLRPSQRPTVARFQPRACRSFATKPASSNWETAPKNVYKNTPAGIPPARTHRSVVGTLRPARERAIALVGGPLSEHGVDRIAALLGGASEVRWVENAWAGEAQFSS